MGRTILLTTLMLIEMAAFLIDCFDSMFSTKSDKLKSSTGDSPCYTKFQRAQIIHLAP